MKPADHLRHLSVVRCCAVRSQSSIILLASQDLQWDLPPRIAGLMSAISAGEKVGSVRGFAVSICNLPYEHES